MPSMPWCLSVGKEIGNRGGAWAVLVRWPLGGPGRCCTGGARRCESRKKKDAVGRHWGWSEGQIGCSYAPGGCKG